MKGDNMSKMTIKECMDAAFQLLNHYSIAGNLVPLSYNDQADDKNRMLNLINDAQMAIAMSVRPIPAFHTVEMPLLPAGAPMAEIEVEMPEDFDQAISVYFSPALDDNGRPVGGNSQCCGPFTRDASSYKWIGDSIILLPNKPAGTYRIEYSRYPIRYNETTPETTQLDNTPDTHPPIPYYVAALIAAEENPKLYYVLYNIWETMLARLVEKKKPHAVIHQICDVYDFSHHWGVD